jgi:stage II sporulation protein D
MMVMRRIGAIVGCVVLLLAAANGTALAAKKKGRPKPAATFTINGGGFGHGIGMSQYGALGFALHGFDYRQILGHYFEGTSVGTLNPEPTVTVLLRDGALTFTGANAANGKPLKPSKHFGVLALASGKLQLISAGIRSKPFSAPLRITGSGPIDVIGLGSYRGSLVLRPDGSGGVETVNAVGLEQYVDGVIAAEMPSSWPAQALEAQAVAARSYAVTDSAVSRDYMVYDDTRSQMYGGVSAETPATDAAAAATAGQVVQYAGLPVVTYFFSSSGGYTESIQNVWLGNSPEAWLKGVPDPYDNSGGNPYYRWRDSMSLAGASSKLRGLFKGKLLGVKVLQTGVSPRVVSARVVGTSGSSNVTGPQLQQLFGTDSTYMTFSTVTASGSTGTGSGTASPSYGLTATTPAAQQTTTTASSASKSGGGGLQLDRRAATVSGRVFPVRSGAFVLVARRVAGRLVTVAAARPSPDGRYSLAVPGPGRYQVLYAGQLGPSVTAG